MSYSYIPHGVKIRLRGKMAGRCQYLGCNDSLWHGSIRAIDRGVPRIFGARRRV